MSGRIRYVKNGNVFSLLGSFCFIYSVQALYTPLHAFHNKYGLPVSLPLYSITIVTTSLVSVLQPLSPTHSESFCTISLFSKNSFLLRLYKFALCLRLSIYSCLSPLPRLSPLFAVSCPNSRSQFTRLGVDLVTPSSSLSPKKLLIIIL